MKAHHVTDNFPIGTSVGLYRDAVFDGGNPAPVGTKLATAVVDANGDLDFGVIVEDGTTFIAAAPVGTGWHLMRLTTTNDQRFNLFDLADVDGGPGELGEILVYDGSSFYTPRRKGALDARDWVGYTDSAVDSGPALNQLLQLAHEYEMAVDLPPWQLLTGEPVVIDSFTEVRGKIGYSSIKVADASECAALVSARKGVGGENGGTERMSLYGIDFIGNLAGNPSFAGAIVDLDGIRPIVRLCNFEDGAIPLSTEMTRAPSEGTNEFEDGIFENIGIRKAHVRGISATGPHDSHFSNLLIRCDDGIGIYTHGTAFVWEGSCHVYGAAVVGVDANGGNMFENLIVEGTTGAKMILRGDSNKIHGGWLFAAGAGDSKIGIEFGGGGGDTAFGTQIVGLRIEDCTVGSLKFNTSAANSVIQARISGTGGEAITGAPHAEIEWDVKKSGTIKWGASVGEGKEMLKILGNLSLLGDLDLADGRIRLTERAAPPAAQANAVKLYAEDDGAGKTKAMARFGTGAAIPFALEGASALRIPYTIDLMGADPRQAEALLGDLANVEYKDTGPGDAFSASTGTLPFQLTGKVILAVWELVMNPAGGAGGGVALYGFKEAHQKVAESTLLGERTGSASVTPINIPLDVTAALSALWEEGRAEGAVRFLVHRIKTDGVHTPVVFKSRLLIVMAPFG